MADEPSPFWLKAKAARASQSVVADLTRPQRSTIHEGGASILLPGHFIPFVEIGLASREL